MNSFLTLWRKEFGNYFISPIAYTALSFFLAIMGLIFFFLVNVLAEGTPGTGVMNLVFGSPFYWMTLILIIPLLTMRLFAEEKRTGTIEVLLTAPISDTAIVAAKFAGVFTFYILMWLPTVVFVMVLQQFSAETPPIDPGVLTACYVGVLLSGAFFISLGMVCSILTSNQITAAITCFALMIAVLFSGLAETMTFNSFALSLANMVSPHQHLSEYSRGIIDTRSVIFYMSGTFFFLFTATRLLESRQWK